MANWNEPGLTDQYQDFLTLLKARDADLATMFNGGTVSNFPDQAIRWNPAASRFERWNLGLTVWEPLTANYAIRVANADNADNAAIAGTATNLGSAGQNAAFFRNAGNLNAGVLAVARGGLGVADPANRGIVICRGGSPVDVLVPGPVGQVLTSKGPSTNPAYEPIAATEAFLMHKSAHFTAEIDAGNSGTAKTLDWTQGNRQKLVLTANCTLTFTAPGGPTNLTLKLIQDVTGGRTVILPATKRWSSGVGPDLTVAPNAVDLLMMYFDGTNYHCALHVDSK